MQRELKLPNDTSCLAELRTAVLEMLDSSLVAPGEAQLVALAVDEAVANVMEHAYEGCAENRPQEVTVLLRVEVSRFSVIIQDCGIEFDPTSVPDVDIREHVAQGRKGGLGILLMCKCCTRVSYHGSGNIVLLEQDIDS